MTVFQNHQRNGEWRYDFELGKRRYHGACLDEQGQPVRTKREARAAEDAARVAARQQQNLARSGIRPGSYTLGQAAARHLARKEGKTDFANHVRYVREILAFEAFAGGRKAMRDVTAEDCDAYARFAAGQTLKKWIGGSRRRKTGTPADAPYWRDTGRPRTKREVNNHLKCLRSIFLVAARTRDPHTRQAVLDEVPEIRLFKMPKRLPRPIGDDELSARLAEAPPWTREAAELARLFGLRRGEVFKVERRHIYRPTKGLRFDAGETKSGNEELVHGGAAGWALLEALDAQARARGQAHLISWPGPKLWRTMLRGEEIATAEWRPLKSISRSWRTTVKRAGIEQPHRFHDVRAQYITEVAKVQKAAAQDAARHQDPATTALYIKLAEIEVANAVAEAVARRPVMAGRPKLKAIK